jgi:hypothetical protein
MVAASLTNQATQNNPSQTNQQGAPLPGSKATTTDPAADLNFSSKAASEAEHERRVRTGVLDNGMEFVSREILNNGASLILSKQQVFSEVISKVQVELDNSMCENAGSWRAICGNRDAAVAPTRAAMRAVMQAFLSSDGDYATLRQALGALSPSGQDVDQVVGWLNASGDISLPGAKAISQDEGTRKLAEALKSVCRRLMTKAIDNPSANIKDGSIDLGAGYFTPNDTIAELFKKIPYDTAAKEVSYHRGTEVEIDSGVTKILRPVNGKLTGDELLFVDAERVHYLGNQVVGVKSGAVQPLGAPQIVTVEQSGAINSNGKAEVVTFTLNQSTTEAAIKVQGLMIAAGLVTAEQVRSVHSKEVADGASLHAGFLKQQYGTVSISDNIIEASEQNANIQDKGSSLQTRMAVTLGLFVEQAQVAGSVQIGEVECQRDLAENQTAAESFAEFARKASQLGVLGSNISIISNGGIGSVPSVNGSVASLEAAGTSLLGEGFCQLRDVNATGQQVQQLKLSTIGGLSYATVVLADGTLMEYRLPSLDYNGGDLRFKTKQAGIVQQLVAEFSKQSADLGTNQLVNLLRQEGELQRLQGAAGGTTIKDVEWLGATLAPNAVIRDVTFVNCLIDFGASRSATFQSCVFETCSVTMHCKEVKIRGCQFTGGMIMGEMSGTLYDETRIKCDVQSCVLEGCSVDMNSYKTFLKKYGHWQPGRLGYEFYASDAGLVRYAFEGANIDATPGSKFALRHLKPFHFAQTLFGANPGGPFGSDIQDLLLSNRIAKGLDALCDLGKRPSLGDLLNAANQNLTNPVDLGELLNYKFTPAIIATHKQIGMYDAYTVLPINRGRQDSSGEHDYVYHFYSRQRSFGGAEKNYGAELVTSPSAAFGGKPTGSPVSEYQSLLDFMHKRRGSQMVPPVTKKMGKNATVAASPDEDAYAQYVE